VPHRARLCTSSTADCGDEARGVYVQVEGVYTQGMDCMRANELCSEYGMLGIRDSDSSKRAARAQGTKCDECFKGNEWAVYCRQCYVLFRISSFAFPGE
jgi:hypothetical protein